MTNEPTEKREGWEEELRERSYGLNAGFVSEGDFSRLCDFIRSTRTQAFNEGYEKGRADEKDSGILLIGNRQFNEGVDAAVDALIPIVKKHNVDSDRKSGALLDELIELMATLRSLKK